MSSVELREMTYATILYRIYDLMRFLFVMRFSTYKVYDGVILILLPNTQKTYLYTAQNIILWAI